jgi:hypothetical protein
MTAVLSKDRIEVSNYNHPYVRLFIGGIGAFLAVMVFKDFYRVLWPLTLFSLFFIPLTGIGVIMGLSLAAAMTFGPDQRWVIERGHITVIETLRKLRREIHYKPEDFERIEVEVNEWDSKPYTYQIVFYCKDKKPLKSPDFNTEAQAQEAKTLFTSW